MLWSCWNWILAYSRSVFMEIIHKSLSSLVHVIFGFQGWKITKTTSRQKNFSLTSNWRKNGVLQSAPWSLLEWQIIHPSLDVLRNLIEAFTRKEPHSILHISHYLILFCNNSSDEVNIWYRKWKSYTNFNMTAGSHYNI